MDPLTRLALVGVAREAAPPEESGALVDAIVTKLADLPLDRRVLLAAGARAASAMAGYRPAESAAAPVAAEPETRPLCSPKAARLLGDLLRGHHDELLPEAFALLARAGQRLPPALLPDALRVKTEPLQAAARLVIGERGAWLARWNESWSWALAASSSVSIEAIERSWTEGTPAARRALFAQARARDAGRARGWLQATWSAEKADERVALLELLAEGLAPDDEAFLEAQLDDRASSVREAAQSLLPRLERSAFVQRMTARADAMLDFKRSALGFLGKRGALEVRPLENVDSAGERDGLLAKPPASLGVGARELRLVRALAAVAPAHWTARFGLKAAELVAAAEATDWAGSLAEGWTRAALVARAESDEGEWLPALWDFWQRVAEKVAGARVSAEMLAQILPRLSAADASARVEALFTDDRSRIDLATALRILPAPWPESLAAQWTRRLQQERFTPSPRFHPLLASLRVAALALPPSSLAAALASAAEPPPSEALPPQWERAIADYSDVLRLRLDLVQEIVP